MKKLVIVLFVFLSIPVTSFPQIVKPITKGNFILSGGAFSQYSEQNSKSIFNISLSPGVGYFFINNLAVGLNTNIYFDLNRYYSPKYYSVGVGPYIKYYFNNGIFLKTESLYSFIHGIENTDPKFREYSLTPGFGYAFFINQKISLEPGVSFMYYISLPDDYRVQHGLAPRMNSLIFEIKFNLFL